MVYAHEYSKYPLPVRLLLLYRRLCRALTLRFHNWLIAPAFQQLDSKLDPRVKVGNPDRIRIGRSVAIAEYTWLYAITDDRDKPNAFKPLIIIGDRCSIGRFCQITCSNQVVLESDVFLSEGVLVTDSIHGYYDIGTPVLHQPLVSLGPVHIGSGTWIGSGARIIGRVTVGRNCVVGANAVIVNRSVPDYCMVAGVPARIIKRYCDKSRCWLSTPVPRTQALTDVGACDLDTARTTPPADFGTDADSSSAR